MSLLLEDWPNPQEPPDNRKGVWMYWLAACVIAGLAVGVVTWFARGGGW